MVASYRAYDKTNEDEDRDILKDLSGNGHDIQLYNFANTTDSGFFEGKLHFDGIDDVGRLLLSKFNPNIDYNNSTVIILGDKLNLNTDAASDNINYIRGNDTSTDISYSRV